MTRRFIILLALVLGAGLASGRDAAAQGFGVYEQGACAMGMAGAVVASPCKDGSAIFFNPAAIAMEKRVINVATTFIKPIGGFTDTNTKQQSDLLDRVYPVPQIYFVQPFKQKFALGFGLFAPYGLSTEWHETQSQGRFLGYKSKVEGIYMQPTFAYSASNKFAIGFGLDLTLTRVELKQHVDLSVQQLAPGITFAQIGVPANTDFGDVQLKGDSTQVGFHLGFLAKPSDRFSIGARYMGRQKANIAGDIATKQILTGLKLPFALSPTLPAGTPIDAIVAPQFQSGAKLGPQSATTELYLPDQFVVGVSIQPTEKVKFNVDYQYVHWKLFDVLDVKGSSGLESKVVESYDDSNGIRFGTEIKASDRFAIRGGFLAHGAAAPDQTVTPNLPEAARKEFTLGFGAGLTKAIRFDFAYQYLMQDDRAGRTGNCGVEAPTVACNNGSYKFHANLIGAGLSLMF